MPEERPGECGRRIAGRDACPTQKGGLPPQRGVSALPSLTAPTTFFAYNVFVRTAGRRGLSLSRTKIERPALPLPWAFYRSKIGYRRGKKCAGRLGTLAQPLGVSVCVDASVFGEKTAPHHNRPQRGQHRVFPLGGVRGCHPPRRRATQALTRADTGFYIFGLQSSTQMGGHWRRMP